MKDSKGTMIRGISLSFGFRLEWELNQNDGCRWIKVPRVRSGNGLNGICGLGAVRLQITSTTLL